MFKVSKALQDAVQKVLDDSPMAEALIGNQSKLDANKNGKLDKQDFKLLRGGKKENEKEKEELEEQRFKKGQDVGDPGLNFKKIAAKAAEKYGSKAAGQRVAGFVLKKKLANSRMSEQTDQIDELKKSTLLSYVGQNAADQVDRASSASFNSGKVGDMYNKAAITRKDIKRVKMMGKALRKLADPNYGNK
jgi:hypothetical protein